MKSGKPSRDYRKPAPGTGCRAILPAGLAALALVCAGPTAAQSKPSRTEPTGTGSVAAVRSEIPTGAQSVVSTTLGKADEAYRAKRSGQGYATENPANHLAAQYAADGVKIRFQNANLDLGFQGWGYGKTGVNEATAAVAPFAEANRVEYRRGALTEWYVNGPLGIEQGFTISQAPGAVASPDSQHDALDIALRLGGTLSASVEPGRHALTLRDQSGVETLRYGPLLAYDASGRELESWMEVQGASLLLRVNTAGAHYPINVDPFVQAAELTVSSAVAGDQLGRAVAVGGNTVVVGAPYVNAYQGAVYVFVEPPNGWANTGMYTAVLTASDGMAGDYFGWSVGINASGDTIVVGAPYVNSQQGAAYVFVAPTNSSGVPSWSTPTTPPTYTAKLMASNEAAGGFFGSSAAVSGSASGGGTIVVGAQGAAYVFVEPAPAGVPTWSAQTPLPSNAELTASGSPDGFGDVVAINESANTIVVGAPAIDDNELEGSAYVFIVPPGGWAMEPTPSATETAELTDGVTVTSPQNPALDWFGNSVGISGNTVVVGAPGATVGDNLQQGAAYVFVAPKPSDYTTWSMDPTPPALTAYNAQLTASNGLGGNYLGTAVGISGNTVVAGATGAESGEGAAYVFVEPTNSNGVLAWSGDVNETAELPPSNGGFSDVFGYAVAISGNTIVVGAPFLTVNNNAYQGAAYVFTSMGTENAVYTPPGPINFGAVQVNTAGTQQVTLTNPIGPAFTINSISLQGSSSAFTVTGVVCNNSTVSPPYSFLSITLAVGQTCSFTLQFVPTVDENGYAEDLVFGTTATSSNAAAGPGGTGQAILLLGDGVEPYANYTNTSSGSPSQVAFGSVDENTPATQTLTLANTGDGPLVVEGTIVMSLSPFSYTQVACDPAVPSPLSFPFTISAAGSCAFTIQFDPTALGPAGGALGILDNAAAGESNLPSTVEGPYFGQSVQLSGTGISAVPTTPTATDSDTITVSDAVTVTPLINTLAGVPFAGPAAWYSTSGLGFNGTSGETQTLTVTNVGEAALVFSGAPQFSLVTFTISQTACSNSATSLPTTLLSGGACTFTILYTPVGNEPTTGTIVFTDNASLSSPPSAQSGSNYTQTISLNGSGSNAAPLPPPSATVTIPTDNELITVTDSEIVKTLFITTAALPNGSLKMYYDTTINASGGSPPYNWTAAGLPPGLNITAAGELSGTPTLAGIFAVTVTVTDSVRDTNFVIFSLAVLAPSLEISASPTTLTIPQGQSGQTTLTFTPLGGYTESVFLSCSGLPANSSCSFTELSPDGALLPVNALTLANNTPAIVVLTINTDVNGMLARMEAAPTPLRPGTILAAIAFWCPFSLLGLIALRRKRKLFTKNPRIFGLCVFVLLAGAMAGVAGCVSGGGFGTYVTPVGTSTVTVVVTPASGSPQTVSIGLTITQQ